MKCPNCGIVLSSENTCDECGWFGGVETIEQSKWLQLLAGQVIAERFVIKQDIDATPGHSTRLYLAENKKAGEVAIKEALSGTLAADRLKLEYDILSTLSHSAFPQVLEIIDSEQSRFLILKASDGVPLAEAWVMPNLAEAEKLDWLIQLCDLLIELHNQDTVYLAIHPEKVLVDEDLRLVLADFSMARRLPITADVRLTGLEYCAPEVYLSPQDVDFRADLYSLNATWYALLLGKPLSSKQFEEMFFAKHPAEFVPDILPAINRTIVKAMQRLPERRHKSMVYFREDLEEIKKQFDRDSLPLVGFYSDTGISRDANEDCYMAEEFHVGDGQETTRCGVYLISDGMGGEAGGRVASQLTVDKIAEIILPELKRFSNNDVRQDLSAQIESLLQDAINEACSTVYMKAHEDPLLRKMGATVALAVLLGCNLYVANVGDSRAYLVNEGGIIQLTRDHTVIAELIERGALDEEKARGHPAQGELTRNIGAKSSAKIGYHHQILKPDDVVLLCCDGLTDVVEDDEILRNVLEARNLQEACYQLVNLANIRGGPDNITIILTRAEETNSDYFQTKTN